MKYLIFLIFMFSYTINAMENFSVEDLVGQEEFNNSAEPIIDLETVSGQAIELEMDDLCDIFGQAMEISDEEAVKKLTGKRKRYNNNQKGNPSKAQKID